MGSQSMWERFLYMLYKVRGEAMQQHLRRRHARVQDKTDYLLLPLRRDSRQLEVGSGVELNSLILKHGHGDQLPLGSFQ